MRLLRNFGYVSALLVCAGCAPSEDGRVDEGPSGAECPEDSTVGWSNFAREFFESYCVECHDSSLRGAERQGAPSAHDFDSLVLTRTIPADHLDEVAASGPLATNRSMPPTDPTPTDEERRKLGEWLACGMPE